MENNLENTQAAAPKKRSTKAAAIAGAALIGAITVVGAFYLLLTKNQIYTDKADIEAPLLTISTAKGGVLEKMLVENGQHVAINMPVAQIDDQVLRADQEGTVVSAENNLGKTFNPGETVVTMIHPEDLNVVAHVDEDKGLNQIQVGQIVSFTVDTFGSKKYVGTVAEISPTSRQSGVVFNISDQREVKQFDVKIKFDQNKYSELKNGMSAKVTIFTK